MTTASRPTFAPAVGGQGRGEAAGSLSSMTKQYSSRDLNSHTKLKYRDLGQGTVEEVRTKDLKRDLEERERQAKDKSDRKDRSREPSSKAIQGSSSAPKKSRSEHGGNLDADDPIEEDSDSSDESDDEDDSAALMAELQRIKSERAAEVLRKVCTSTSYSLIY